VRILDTENETLATHVSLEPLLESQAMGVKPPKIKSPVVTDEGGFSESQMANR
jgi:hypothetical protein